MSNDKTRRKMLGITGVSIGALVGSGTVSADDSDTQSHAIKVEDGRFVLDRDKVAGSRQYEILKPAVEDFNEAIEDGHIKLEESQGTIKMQSDVAEMVEGDE